MARHTSWYVTPSMPRLHIEPIPTDKTDDASVSNIAPYKTAQAHPPTQHVTPSQAHAPTQTPTRSHALLENLLDLLANVLLRRAAHVDVRAVRRREVAADGLAEAGGAVRARAVNEQRVKEHRVPCSRRHDHTESAGTQCAPVMFTATTMSYEHAQHTRTHKHDTVGGMQWPYTTPWATAPVSISR